MLCSRILATFVGKTVSTYRIFAKLFDNQSGGFISSVAFGERSGANTNISYTATFKLRLVLYSWWNSSIYFLVCLQGIWVSLQLMLWFKMEWMSWCWLEQWLKILMIGQVNFVGFHSVGLSASNNESSITTPGTASSKEYRNESERLIMRSTANPPRRVGNGFL